MARQEITPHICTVCSCQFTEGGVDGNFGMIPVQFCPTCFSCMCDMAAQYLDINDESNPLHEELIKHLKGTRHIVINRQHGGFSLSREAQLFYLATAGISYTLEPQQDRDTTNRLGPCITVNGHTWNDRAIPRDDPALITTIRKLGRNANGECANLKIVEIPADVTWAIEEYDGLEWVSEQHRTWS